MGQLLSHPIQDKTLDHKDHETLSYSIGSMQGYRMSMEDAHDVRVNEDESLAVFGVFDGHGGKHCAEYLSENLPRRILRILNESEGLQLGDYIRLIKDSFFKADHDLSKLPNTLNCGSTGIIATIVKGKYIIVSNTGDSRCILSVNGLAKTLSFDHKPAIMNERIRIENSNGYILNNRINEILALSRALGDFKFKVPYLSGSHNKYIMKNKKFYRKGLVLLPPELFQVTAEPDFMIYDLSNETPEFIVLACDGIWDCYKNGQLVKVIRQKLGLGWTLNRIIEFVLDDCLLMANSYTGIGFDNMTLIIVALHENGNIDEWYELMRHRVQYEEN
ncbi:uncharacterized protein PRCAT00006240001 [Priceomyces carsonii]|uniref:uncharacterized protein n=1 Tax=Priceomyces carsonii TaxID=28549 RepID=UPI002EDA1BAE|nr:unnamed protein product [Priceomyces carsonii]